MAILNFGLVALRVYLGPLSSTGGQLPPVMLLQIMFVFKFPDHVLDNIGRTFNLTADMD